MDNHERELDKICWEKQKNENWKKLTDPLAQDPAIHSRFNNFIKKFYWRFRLKKGMPRGSYSPEINFQGFKEFVISETFLGSCFNSRDKPFRGAHSIIHISINQVYLLNRLGMEKFITSNSNGFLLGDYSFWKIHFDKLIRTIAHELAHAYQYTINLEKEGEISQCESSGKKDADGNFLYPELVAEHTQLIEEIESMIIGSTEYQEFKNWWTNSAAFPETPEKDEEEEFEKLVSLLKGSKDLLGLEKNYHAIKKNPFYDRNKNTLCGNENNQQLLDNCYAKKMTDLETSSTNSPNNTFNFNGSLGIFILILWGIALLAIVIFIFSGRKGNNKKSLSL